MLTLATPPPLSHRRPRCQDPGCDCGGSVQLVEVFHVATGKPLGLYCWRAAERHLRRASLDEAEERRRGAEVPALVAEPC